MNRKFIAKELLKAAKDILAAEPLNEKDVQRHLDVIFTNIRNLQKAAEAYSNALSGLESIIDDAKYFKLKDSKEIPARIKSIEVLAKNRFDERLKKILNNLKELEEK